jgi:hypothetical protein
MISANVGDFSKVLLIVDFIILLLGAFYSARKNRLVFFGIILLIIENILFIALPRYNLDLLFHDLILFIPLLLGYFLILMGFKESLK